MQTDIDNLREQAENLNACLERLRSNMSNFPDPREVRWLESMMVSSLIALETHINQLERLEYRNPMRSAIFKK